MYEYFVSYAWRDRRHDLGVGNTTIAVKQPIKTFEHIREIENVINTDIGTNKVVLINFILLDAPKIIEVLD